MKLRQALDKARQRREEDPEAKIIDLQAVPTTLDGEWAPPAYTVSTRVELDEQTLIANRCVCFRSDAPELEHYKVLRTKIQQVAAAKGWNAVMITSPGPCGAKTLVAVNLALTFAKAFNQTVMLVDADLRHQQVHRLLGYASEAGLVDYLVDRRPLPELIVWPSIEQLTVVSGGRSAANSAELTGSPRMRSLVGELKSRYRDRVVLFDSAPVLEGADALQLAALVDGIVVVVAEGATGMREVKRAVAMLPPEKLIGCALAQPGAKPGRKR